MATADVSSALIGCDGGDDQPRFVSIAEMDSRRHPMSWDIGILTVVALVVLLLGKMAGRSRRPRRVPQGYGTRMTRRTTYEMGYTDGFQAGYRAGQMKPSFPPALWQHMLVLVHPDHHEGSPLHPMAAEVTRWLLMHRPRACAEMN
jgi:hypothetical protein